MEDVNTQSESGIAAFVHCRTCLKELPVGSSPQEWGSLECGFLPSGFFRVWCKRHEEEVLTFRAAPGKTRLGDFPGCFQDGGN